MPLKKFYISIYSFCQYENGSSVAWNSHFDGEPCFPHGVKGIFMSGNAKIGKNCMIFQQVIIGSNTLFYSKGFGTPTLGNDCYIGAGAKIIGNVWVGNNVRVGANAVIYKDVPNNSVVVPAGQKLLERYILLDNLFYSDQGSWVFWKNGGWNPLTDQKR